MVKSFYIGQTTILHLMQYSYLAAILFCLILIWGKIQKSYLDWSFVLVQETILYQTVKQPFRHFETDILEGEYLDWIIKEKRVIDDFNFFMYKRIS